MNIWNRIKNHELDRVGLICGSVGCLLAILIFGYPVWELLLTIPATYFIGYRIFNGKWI